ncbi:helix-turn-helix domain-containing protein [Inediibacterium massiliense]|uniref:helix-turn-helix domain-containing protein n=1 Tax=Inediibacterium massiliense TaxID=1658111 RepID=UPI0006B59541|nr:helix-turn-helix transcriptional regulator [Inediibacterium massiliense]
MGKIILKLEEVLDKKEKTVYWLAKQTGISNNNLHKIVANDTTSIRFDKLVSIMEALEITNIEDIMQYASNEKED